jgi:hypothetical protein
LVYGIYAGRLYTKPMKKKRKINPKPIKVRIRFEELGDSPPSGRNSTNFGECNPPSKEIVIDPRQSEQEMIDTIVHEVLHIIYPKTSEAVIASNATTVASVLWRLGYRSKSIPKS